VLYLECRWEELALVEKLGIFENSSKNISVKFMPAALAQGVA
jgi:hypothetical protein